MKRLIIIVSFAVLTILTASQLCFAEDSLDAIKKFKPEDKYFKAAIKSAHFYIEVNTIDTINTHFIELINGYKLPVSAKGCKDGKYTGETPEDAFDYCHIVEIEIKDEKIVSVDYDEVKKSGKSKQDDKEYNKNMMQAGSSPAIAYPLYEKRLIEKQNIMEVDAVSGASFSLYRFRLAMTIALMKARLK